MGPGNVVHLNPDEDVLFGDPKRPASGFGSFMKEMCVQMGAALEIPHDILMKEFNSSYSASRGALLEAWKAFGCIDSGSSMISAARCISAGWRRLWRVEEFQHQAFSLIH
ncbi:MAG: phage portal protein [Gallintestinimicrobium sp.]